MQNYLEVRSKVCKTCGAEKSFDDFSPHPTGKYKLRPDCKDCRRLFIREQYNGGGERTRALHLSRQRKHRYGLTTPEYEAFIGRAGACEICGTASGLCIDHDHTTGDLRGVLCKNCNNAIGLFKENIDTLKSAVDYLSRGIVESL